MTIIDENIQEDQRVMLRRWRIHVNQIGKDVGHKGMKDREIVRLLHQSRNPTFITRDVGFYSSRPCHAGYAIVVLMVEKMEVAFFVRRLYRHPSFASRAQRMGKVLRVSSAGVWFWRLHAEAEVRIDWKE